MLITSLVLSLTAAATPVQDAGPVSAIDAVMANTTLQAAGCHPFASKTPACRLSIKQEKQARAEEQTAAAVCHPDPTKSRACDARNLQEKKVAQTARVEKADAETAGGE